MSNLRNHLLELISWQASKSGSDRAADPMDLRPGEGAVNLVERRPLVFRKR